MVEVRSNGAPGYILAETKAAGRRVCAFCYRPGAAVRHEVTHKNGARFLICILCAKQLLNEIADAGVLA